MGIIINLVLGGVAVFVVSYILPGVELDNFVTALIVALVMGLVNAFIKPVILILTLPINVLTLGLFTVVVNALLVLLVDALIPGFSIDGFIWAVIFSLVLSVLNIFLNKAKI